MGHLETLVSMMDVPLVRVAPMTYRKKKMNLFLKPGEVCISREPAIVTTILGSCIAVTMFSERLKIGGICHALLPKHPPSKRWKEFHYVDSSILYMVKEFETMGIAGHEIEIKIFGGADIFSVVGRKSVGQANVETALSTIEEKKLNILFSDFGGILGRKLYFYTHTGDVLLKHIKRMPN